MTGFQTKAAAAAAATPQPAPFAEAKADATVTLLPAAAVPAAATAEPTYEAINETDSGGTTYVSCCNNESICGKKNYRNKKEATRLSNELK